MCNSDGIGWEICFGCSNVLFFEDGGQCNIYYMKKCVGKDVYWFDFCDVQEDLVESCDIGCMEG